MTTAGQRRIASPAPLAPVPAPGGTARLAGRLVARIGFGAMQLERQHADRDAALAVLRQAVGAGVNHIDTAQFYGAATRSSGPRWRPTPTTWCWRARSGRTGTAAAGSSRAAAGAAARPG